LPEVGRRRGIAGPPGFIDNGDFEQGLTGWRVVSGKAFAKQPVAAVTIGAADIEFGGRPVVALGGDYWHTSAFPLGQNGTSLIRVVTRAAGILESGRFTVSKRFLAYRLGGSKGGGSAIELRVPATTATRLGLKALDKPGADGYVAVRRATPSGSDVLREATWDLGKPGSGQTLLGEPAKVRLRVDASPKRPRRLLVDHVRLVDRPPRRFRPPVWGWADIHCHPTAQAGFGDLLAGHMHGPVEDLGSCLEIHGHEHGNPLRPVGLALEGGRYNDGSLATTGWTTGTPGFDEQLGFRGWPAFDEITHIKTHQDWIRRAYEGGQRLMVALIVHNQMLAAISTATKLIFEAQSDRDTVEPQVQMLREFVAHNGDWCGLARTPAEARDLIEANKMAFVLGLETDSINDWVKDEQFSSDPSDANRDAIHATIHDYFAYLYDLGVVQVNLIHLTDNAFGGMALYDVMFMVNSWQRRGRLPDTEDGFTPHAANPDEVVCTPVTLPSVLWEKLEPAAQKLGITSPPFSGVGVYGHGDRNANGLTVAGEVALLEAMRLGMVVDMDHMSEHSAHGAFGVATKTIPGSTYPLVSAHNGARKLAPRPPARLPTPSDTPGPGERRSPHTWPNESLKSETQLERIKTTGGMFGHGIAGKDSRSYGTVQNDCPGTSKTVAQGLEYVTHRLEMPVALGTDWNALLPGPGPRFGPRAAIGLLGELEPVDDWAASVRSERLAGALAQRQGVRYGSGLKDWRSHRFPDTGLYEDTSFGAEARFLWQGLVLRDSGEDLTNPDLVTLLRDETLGQAPALELARGLAGLTSLTGPPGTTGSDFHRAAVVAHDSAIPLATENDHVQALVGGLVVIERLWDKMRESTAPPLQRSTAGPVREFDYNLDGLAHYGMLPDMLQDLKNVGLPENVIDGFFRSAERYIQVWERSVQAAAKIPHPKPGGP
jgi:microsomal dipeptidase-like Zn-dependent dipeptidase